MLTSILLIALCSAIVQARHAVLKQDKASQEYAGHYYDWQKTRQPEPPYMKPYHQTLVMKIFLAEKQPGEQSKVYLTFEQAVEVIKRLDSLTLGIPKIVYLVGWQHNGHDSKYPD